MAKDGDYRAELLGEMVREANAHDELVAEGFDANATGANAFNSEDCIYVRVQHDFDKKILYGLSTRFGNLIECTFSCGLNECRILDINKLVKQIAS